MQLHNYSDLAIWLAYVAIPIVLLAFTRRRRDIPFRHVFWLFGAFIILCGMTHFMEFYTFSSPIYRLSGLVKLLTAIVSWGTVIALIPITPKALAMRSPEALEREIDARTAELTRANEELKRRTAEVDELNARLRRAMAETHHRVKNNLQVVSALVDMQVLSDLESVPKHELNRIAQHIRSLALIHELLTRQARSDDEVEFVSGREALNNIMPVLRDILQGRNIEVSADDFEVPVKHGSALAVLVNELVSNAVKHGRGDVVVTLERLPEDSDNPYGAGRLAVCDEGPGFPKGFDSTRSANTGLELVQSLGKWDLRGTMRFFNRPEGGAGVEVVFPLESVERRAPLLAAS